MDLLNGVCANCNRQDLGVEAKQCSRKYGISILYFIILYFLCFYLIIYLQLRDLTHVVPFLYISATKGCKSTTYCSRECQQKDWSHHKKICKFLNPGKAQQLRHPYHIKFVGMPEKMLAGLSGMPVDCKKLFELFRATESDEENRLEKMTKIVKRIPMVMREFLLQQAIAVMLSFSTKSIERPTSPVLVLLRAGEVGPNFLSHFVDTRTPDNMSYTALHYLAELTTPDVEKMERQVVIAKQLIGHGADVNARAAPGQNNISPLHKACSICTNLDLIKLFLDNGADPNQVDDSGETPLMWTLEKSPSAARILLTYPYENNIAPAIDVNIRTSQGSTYLGGLIYNIQCGALRTFKICFRPEFEPDVEWTHLLPYQYYLQQLEELKVLAVERGATGAAEDWDDPNRTTTTEENNGNLDLFSISAAAQSYPLMLAVSSTRTCFRKGVLIGTAIIHFIFLTKKACISRP